MKVLVSVTDDNIDADVPEGMVVEITPESATALLRLIERTRSFLDGLAKEGLASRHTEVILGDGEHLPLTAVARVWLDTDGDFEEEIGDEKMLLLPEGFALDDLPEESGARTDDHRVEVFEDGIVFRARGRYDDITYRSEKFSTELLLKIAAGRSTELEEAKIAHTSE